MTLASLSVLAVGETHPDNRGTMHDILLLYRSCCLQSLALSNILKPGPYTIETLILHIESEFVWNRGDPVQFYLLAGNTTRLALRMGLHRDSSRIESHISIFDAEMRRRVWNQLLQMEFLSTVYVGLPAMIPSIESDTLPPRNLEDSDFGKDSTSLPDSRPETELTPVTYNIFKGRLFKVAGRIAVLQHRLSTPNYNEVMSFDQAVMDAYSSIPEKFRQQPSGLLITDTPDKMIKRLSMALMFHKTRLMLHRGYLNSSDPEMAYSRLTTVNTAVELLQLQAFLHEAFLPGGPLSRDRWFLSGLSMPDFVMAGMIVFATLARSSGMTPTSPVVPVSEEMKSRMIKLLRTSHEIWNQTDNLSAEAKKASRLIGTLLAQLDATFGFSATNTSYAQTASSVNSTASRAPFSIFGP